MEWMWTWGGRCFGYRIDDALFTSDGYEAGRFVEDEIYGADGCYLGEVKNQNRLITNLSKTGGQRHPFSPSRRGPYVGYLDYIGYVMYVGYEDFPDPSKFRG